jgi:hypothetical protein
VPLAQLTERRFLRIRERELVSQRSEAEAAMTTLATADAVRTRASPRSLPSAARGPYPTILGAHDRDGPHDRDDPGETKEPEDSPSVSVQQNGSHHVFLSFRPLARLPGRNDDRLAIP